MFAVHQQILLHKMKIHTLEKIFEIEMLELDQWVARPYKNNFFEIVYIENGSGNQCINYNNFSYQSGNIFLLPPLNCHSFVIDKPTRFYFIRFPDNYFHRKTITADYKEWFSNISYILANYNRVPGDIVASESERRYIIHTIMTIYNESQRGDAFSESIISGGLALILNYLARNIEQRIVGQQGEAENKFGKIVRYINHHLLDKERLKIATIANEFNISNSYFSDYFKRQAGINLNDYIVKAKLRLAETYITHTDMSIKEIAHELNFTDSSYLSNSFKRCYGMTIREYKSTGTTHRCSSNVAYAMGG